MRIKKLDMQVCKFKLVKGFSLTQYGMNEEVALYIHIPSYSMQ